MEVAFLDLGVVATSGMPNRSARFLRFSCSESVVSRGTPNRSARCFRFSRSEPAGAGSGTAWVGCGEEGAGGETGRGWGSSEGSRPG